MLILVEQITSSWTSVLSTSALPFAITLKMTSKIPISSVAKVMLLQASDESGGEGHPGYVIIELDDVTW